MSLHHGGQMSAAKVLTFLRDLGVQVSAGWLATELAHRQERFHAEAAAVVAAGLASSPWQWLDETGTRMDGQNRHCHVVGNDLFTGYRTTATKDRVAVLDVLRAGAPRTYRYDAGAAAALAEAGVAGRTQQRLAHLPRDAVRDEATLAAWLDEHLPGLGVRCRKTIRDVLGAAAYRARTDGPVVRRLVTDDAPQFAGATEARALCWVHAGRHVKQLAPVLPGHRRALTVFLRRFWRYYHPLVA